MLWDNIDVCTHPLSDPYCLLAIPAAIATIGIGSPNYVKRIIITVTVMHITIRYTYPNLIQNKNTI